MHEGGERNSLFDADGDLHRLSDLLTHDHNEANKLGRRKLRQDEILVRQGALRDDDLVGGCVDLADLGLGAVRIERDLKDRLLARLGVFKAVADDLEAAAYWEALLWESGR